jgi:hypothetical protein
MSRFRTTFSTSLSPAAPALRLPSWNGALPPAPTSDQDLLQALAANQPARRTRIYDLSGTLHCSIIGTCLSAAELRQILLKLDVDGAHDASDHDLHAKGVLLAGKHSPAAKLLNKALDRRHKVALSQFDKVKTAADLRRLWDAAVQRGDAVLFPVDCVSHQATWLVKRLCRQPGKTFVPLRSAGLGSFLAALRDPASGIMRAMCH